jgi:3-methylcrotonyl-CoA carboxylase alpha subunit
MFSKILIANRGGFACRIIVTARHPGIRSLAVFSQAGTRVCRAREGKS